VRRGGQASLHGVFDRGGELGFSGGELLVAVGCAGGEASSGKLFLFALPTGGKSGLILGLLQFPTDLPNLSNSAQANLAHPAVKFRIVALLA
jgi:hypothetical protein